MSKEQNYFKRATVTIPYEDFQKALEPKESDDPNNDTTLRANVEYLNSLVRDVASGEIKMAEAEDYLLFQTPLGKVILANIQDYKGI